MIYKIQIYFKHITEFTVLFNCIFFLSTDIHSSTTIMWWSISYFDVERVLHIKKFGKPLIQP